MELSKNLKLQYGVSGLLIVLAFWAGRWYGGMPSAPNTETLHALGKPAKPKPPRSAATTVDWPPGAGGPAGPGLIEPPMLPDPKPTEPRDAGPWIDPDPAKPLAQPTGPEPPAHNNGPLMELPEPPNR